MQYWAGNQAPPKLLGIVHRPIVNEAMPPLKWARPLRGRILPRWDLWMAVEYERDSQQTEKKSRIIIKFNTKI